MSTPVTALACVAVSTASTTAIATSVMLNHY